MSTEQAQPSEDRATLPDALRRQDNEAIMLLRQKWKRLNVRNEHWMCCIVGEEGMGKSWTGIKIGSMIDPNFGADNVFFHPAEALERLRDGDFSAGDVWVLDEAGVGLGNRTWHDSGQVKLNQALQLIRSHNIGFIFTLPTLNELDKQAKNRLQNVYEVREKRDGSFIRGRWFTSEVDRMGFNSRRRDVWWDYEVVNGKEVQSVAFTPPPQEIVEPYEEKKEAFQREFYDETIAELRGEDAPETDEQQTIPELAAEIAEQGIADYLGWHGGHNKPKLSREALAEKHNLSIRESKRVKELLLQEHAVDVEKAWEENRA